MFIMFFFYPVALRACPPPRLVHPPTFRRAPEGAARPSEGTGSPPPPDRAKRGDDGGEPILISRASRCAHLEHVHSSCCGALGSLLGVSWKRLGGFLGPLGGFLEASWGLLGASWGVLGRFCAVSPLRRPSWGTLAGALGPSWDPLTPPWGPLGPSWGPLWAVFGFSWAVMGASWGLLGPSWGHFGRC